MDVLFHGKSDILLIFISLNPLVLDMHPSKGLREMFLLESEGESRGVSGRTMLVR